MNRKTFLSLLLGALGSLIVLLKNPFTNSPKKTNSTAAKAVLDSDRLKTLNQMAECIYPADSSPGALKLGIENFFRRQISSRHYKQHLPSINKAIALADRAADAQAGGTFRQLPLRNQNEVMRLFADGKLTKDPSESKRLFSVVMDLTLEGCFSHPKHGGNRDGRAWRIMRGALNKRWFNV